jgi:hypothetical protein
MKITHHIKAPNGPIKLTASGSVMAVDIIEGLKKVMEDPAFKPGMDILWDFRDVRSEISKADQIREIVSYIRTNQDRRGGNYRVALVVTRDIDFGLARMYEAYSQELPFEIRIFKNLNDAENWLASAK